MKSTEPFNQLNLRRNYKTVSIEHVDDGRGYHIYLDQHPLKTPSGITAQIPNKQISAKIAKEWRSVKQTIRPDKMPLTQLIFTTLDIVIPRQSELIDQLIKYADSDLLRYPTVDRPDLFLLQKQHWYPIITWAAQQFDVHFSIESQLNIVDLESETRLRLKNYFAQLNPFQFYAIYQLAETCKSVILALALFHKKTSPRQAIEICFIEEILQQEKWGKDSSLQNSQQSCINNIHDILLLIAD